MAEDQDEKTMSRSEISLLRAKRQIRILVDLIFAKGLSHSLEVAKRLEDPFVLAEFYKSLICDIYEELIERKKLKKI